MKSYLTFFLLLTFADLARTKVFTADLNARSSRLPRNVQNNLLTPLSLHVASKIFSRFANTLVTSVMENKSPQNKEAAFVVQLPQTAFISNFSMEVNGVLYIGQVKEKNAAREEYEKAKNKSLNTGLVSRHSESAVRGMDKFEIRFNVAPNSTAEFRLNYQQLLERRKGYYEQVISVRPKQIVPVLNVSIGIEEPQTLRYVDVMKIRKDPSDSLVKDPGAKVTKISPKSVHIEYSPNEVEQKKQGLQGIDGDFIVRYDVQHGSDAGVIQVLGSYFVQYFSPSGLNPLAKNVVFVIDVSGSMSGTKITQTRQAMHAILSQLRAGDSFNIVLFNGGASMWKSEALLVNAGNIQAAKTFVNERVKARGGTNINDALLMALRLLKNTAEQPSSQIAGNVPLVLFLTDGQPTSGVTDTLQIRRNILAANGIAAPIFSLGFGFNLNFDFLKALSAENKATARRIYPDKDASSQLEGFFDEISTPLLLRISFEYPKDIVDEAHTTTMSFAQYYNGSELVVSGKFKEGVSSRAMSMNIRGYAGKNPVKYTTVSRTVLELTIPSDKVLIEDFTERLWAYMKIKELLLQLLVSNDRNEQARLKSEALRLSLKYHFVTPLTSLVVVQSDSYLGTNQESGGTVVYDPNLTAGIGKSSIGLPLLFMLSFFVRFCFD